VYNLLIKTRDDINKFGKERKGFSLFFTTPKAAKN